MAVFLFLLALSSCLTIVSLPRPRRPGTSRRTETNAPRPPRPPVAAEERPAEGTPAEPEMPEDPSAPEASEERPAEGTPAEPETSEDPSAPEASAAEAAVETEDGYLVAPGDSLPFWRKAMTRAVAAKYRAKRYKTFCNIYVADTLKKHFGQEMFNKVFPDGIKGPEVMGKAWMTNPNLVRLDPEHYSTLDIQALADEGYIILLSYFNKKGRSHLAFVGHTGLVFFTVPPVKKLEGKRADDLDPDWLPVVVQAGTYCGVTSVAYASNGWLKAGNDLFAAGIVRFYVIRA